MCQELELHDAITVNAEGTEEFCLTMLMIAKITKQQWLMKEIYVWSIGGMILKGEFLCVDLIYSLQRYYRIWKQILTCGWKSITETWKTRVMSF